MPRDRDRGLETGSTVSRSSQRSGGSDALMGEGIERIQVQTSVFQRKTQLILKETRGLQVEIDEYKRQIDQYRVKMGGLTALPINDKFIKHQVAIMEGRLLKSKVAYMNAVEHNRKLRVAVDEIRRERVIQQDVAQRLKSDVLGVMADSEQVDAKIKTTESATKKVQHQLEEFKAWSKANLDAHEARWASLDDGGPEGFKIPTTPPPMSGDEDEGGAAPGSPPPRLAPEDDGVQLPVIDDAFFENLPARLGTLSSAQEKKLRDRIGREEWDTAIMTIQEQKVMEKVERYEEIFATIKEQLKVEDLDGFNHLFSYREEQNYAIICHINELNEEATKLEEAIAEVKKQKNEMATELSTDNEGRKKVSQVLSTKLEETSAKLAYYMERAGALSETAGAFKKGIGRLYAFMSGMAKEEEVPSLTELNMIRFLGIVEDEVFRVASIALSQKNSPSPSRPGSGLSRPGSRRRMRPGTADETDTLRQGPGIPTGMLTTIKVEPPNVSAMQALLTAEEEEKDDLGATKPLTVDQLRTMTMKMASTGASFLSSPGTTMGGAKARSPAANAVTPSAKGATKGVRKGKAKA